jgi:hypothetical protein
MADYAPTVPIVLVGTKYDEYIDILSARLRRSNPNPREPLDRAVREEFRRTQIMIETELQRVQNARFEASVYVSKGA